MITIEVNGIEYDNIIDAEISKSIDSLCGAFRLSAATNSIGAFPFTVGDFCKVKINGESVISGFIDVAERGYSSSSSTIALSGRDKTSDIVDSTIGADIDFNGNISLKSLIEKILSKSSISGIAVIDSVGSIRKFSASEKISSGIGTTVFKAIEGYCRKRQVLVTSNGDGDLVLTRGEGIDSNFSIVNTLNRGNVHNVLDALFTKNHSERFNKYVVVSNLNVSSLNSSGLVDSDSVSSQIGDAAVDDEIRSSRNFYVLAEKASDVEDCKERAIWQANIARARSTEYKATVQGHINYNNNEVWKVNRLVDVDDELCGIKAKMLISSLSFKLDLQSGSRTELVMVPKDAYQLISSEPEKQKKTNDIARLFQ